MKVKGCSCGTCFGDEFTVTVDGDDDSRFPEGYIRYYIKCDKCHNRSFSTIRREHFSDTQEEMKEVVKKYALTSAAPGCNTCVYFASNLKSPLNINKDNFFMCHIGKNPVTFIHDDGQIFTLCKEHPFFEDWSFRRSYYLKELELGIKLEAADEHRI